MYMGIGIGIPAVPGESRVHCATNRAAPCSQYQIKQSLAPLKLGKVDQSATVPLVLDPSERRLKLDTGRAFTGNPNAPPRHTIRFMTESRPGRRRGSRPIDQLLLDLTSYALDHCHHVDDDTDRCCKSRIQVVNYLHTYLLTCRPFSRSWSKVLLRYV